MLVARADAPRALPALAGLAAGLALWTHPIAVVYLVACALYAWVALRDRSAQGRLIPMAVMAAPGFVLGLAPAVAYNVAEGFPSARYVLAGGTAPGSALLNLWGLARYGAPVLAGLAEGTASKELLDADWPGRPGSVAATTALLWLAAALVLWSHRGALTPHKAPPSARAAAPFLLVLLLIPPLVAVSRFAELWAEPRYALPAYAAVPLLGASIWRLANRSRALPFLALAALLAANVGSLLTTRPALALPTSAGSSDAANRAVLIDYLESHGLTRIYTDYWIGYPLAFESREAIIPAIRSGGFDRRDAYAHQVWVEPDPAFVFPRDALGDREFRQDLAAAGGTADVAEVSVYRVYTRVRPLDVLRP